MRLKLWGKDRPPSITFWLRSLFQLLEFDYFLHTRIVLKPFVILFLAVGMTVVIAALVVVVMIRTRRPHEGIRKWVKESAEAWNDETSRKPVARPKQMHLDQIMESAKPADSPFSDLNQITTAATNLWEEEVVEKHRISRQARQTRRRRHTQERQLRRQAKQAKSGSLGVDSANSVKEVGENPEGAPVSPLIPAELPPSFPPRDNERKRPVSPIVTKPDFLPVSADDQEEAKRSE